jgi:hypothetical protein
MKTPDQGLYFNDFGRFLRAFQALGACQGGTS